MDDAYRLEQLKRIGRVYGRPALLLSGGALLGLYHFGVIKTLFEQDLLPRTISGSSMGSIMAAWTCCHTDDELRAMFADLSLIPRDALERLPMREMLRQGTVMDQAKLWPLPGQGAARHDVCRVAAALAADPERHRCRSPRGRRRGC